MIKGGSRHNEVIIIINERNFSTQFFSEKFSVRKDVVSEKAERAVQEYMAMSYAPAPGQTMTEKDAEKIIRLIQSLDRVREEDDELALLVYEKAKPYFDGRMSAGDAAEIICKIFG